MFAFVRCRECLVLAALIFSIKSATAPDTSIKLPNAATRNLAFSPDGTKLAAAGSQWVQLYELAKPEAEPIKFQGSPGGINSIAFSPDGSQFAACGDGGDVLLWPVVDPSKPVKLQTGEQRATCVRFSADGKTLGVVVNDGAQTWSLESQTKLSSVRLPNMPESKRVMLSADLKHAASRHEYPGASSVQLWDVATGKELPEPQFQSSVWGTPAFSGDGKFIAAATMGSTAEVVTLKGKSAATIPGLAMHVAFAERSPRYLLAVGTWNVKGDNTVTVINLKTKKQAVVIDKLPNVPEALSISADGKRVAVKAKFENFIHVNAVPAKITK